MESEPLWNKVSDAQLKAMLAKHGIRHDTTVILYGRDVYTAARVAQIMLYAGVKDVRLLDGGWRTHADAGLPVERGMPADVKPEPDFGVAIPAQPQLMLDMEQARALLHRQDASLVSIHFYLAGIYRHHQRIQLYQAKRRNCRRALGTCGQRLHAWELHAGQRQLLMAQGYRRHWKQRYPPDQHQFAFSGAPLAQASGNVYVRAGDGLEKRRRV